MLALEEPEPFAKNIPADLAEEFLTQKQTAKFLKRTPRQLQTWDKLGIGPPKIAFQKLVLYRKSALLDWLVSHEKQPVRAKRRG
jgi:hypothetical protein